MLWNVLVSVSFSFPSSNFLSFFSRPRLFISCPCPRIDCLSMLLLLENSIRIQDLDLCILFACKKSFHLGPVMWHIKEMYVSINWFLYTDLQIFLSVIICICITLNMASYWCLQFHALHMGHSRLFAMLIYKFLLHQWEIWQLPSTIFYLNVQF